MSAGRNSATTFGRSTSKRLNCFAITDVLAERVRKMGGTTLRSIGDIARQRRFANDMLAEMRDDNHRFVTSMREARDVCNDHRHVATMSLLKNYIDEAEKRVWLLYEISRQGEPSRH